MTSCSFRECKNTSRNTNKQKGVTFHRFPKEPRDRERWDKIIREERKDGYWISNKYSRVCSAHFTENNFYSTPTGRNKFKTCAVPSHQVSQTGHSHCDSAAAVSPVSGGESPVSGGESRAGEEESSASGGDEGGSGRGGEGACATCGGAVGTHGRRARGCPAEQFVQAAIFPRELNEKTLLCNECYKRYCDKGKQKCQKTRGKTSHTKKASKRVALSEESANVKVRTPPTSDVASAPQPSVILPNYKRTSSCSEGCLFPYCAKKNLHVIPQYVKQCLLRDYKLYTPEDCQVCGKHLFSNNWKPLLERAHSDFTVQQIEDVISALTTHLTAFNFDNIEDIPPNLLLYCTGMNHGQLQKILEKLPSLMRKTETPLLALTAYLTKLRTNDSFDRLSTLFQTTTPRLEELTTVAKDCMLKEFIPLSLDKTKRELESYLNTSDDPVLRYLQEHFYEDAATTKERAATTQERAATNKERAATHSRSETLATSKPSQSLKRENSSDSDEDIQASKVRAKKRLKKKVETKKSKDKDSAQETVVKLEIEFESPERSKARLMSESSKSSDDEDSGQPRVEEAPRNENEVDEGETANLEDILIYAPKPSDLQNDPLDTVPTPLLEVKSEEEPVTIKEEPEECDPQKQLAAGTSQPTGDSSFTVYYTKGASNFVQGPKPKP